MRTKQQTDVHTVYLSLGSNVGDRQVYLEAALEQLNPHVLVDRVSSVYETEPAYVLDQPRFLNVVLVGRTVLSPLALLDRLKAIEEQLGRTYEVRFGPRTIDLDILLYDNLVLQTETLTIPHPRMAERPFVLVPLSELAADITPPGWDKSVGALAEIVHGNGDIVLRRGMLCVDSAH